jgi:hypothetical protein
MDRSPATGSLSVAAAEFGPFDGRSWFNTAHQGPLPHAAVQASERAAALKAAPHRIGDDDFSEVPERLRGLRPVVGPRRSRSLVTTWEVHAVDHGFGRPSGYTS